MAIWGRARAGPIVTILLLALGVAAPLASVRGAHAQQDLTQVLPMNEPTLVAEGSPSLSGPFLEVVYNRGTALISVRARNAPLDVLLREVARQADLRIDVREETDPRDRVSTDIHGVRLEDALRRLLQEFNAAFAYSATLSDAGDQAQPRLVRLILLSRKTSHAVEARGPRDQPLHEVNPNASREDPRLDLTALLRRLLEGERDDVNVIISALRGPGRDQEREAVVEALIQRLDNGAFPPLDSVIAALKELAQETAIAALAQRLQESNPRVRAMAAATLGRLQDERAIEALASALYDTDSTTRQAAATSLATIGGAQATEALLQAYAAADNRVRYPIAVAIRSHGGESSQRLLEDLTWARAGAREPTAAETAITNPNAR